MSNNDLRKILLIAPQPFFATRGTPINVRAVVTSLARLGLEVDLLTYSYGSDLQLEGVRIIRGAWLPFVKEVPIGPSWTKIGLDVLLSIRALALITRHKYTLIHGIEEGGFIAAVLAKLRGIPFIYDMDSCVIDQLELSGFVRPGRCLRWMGNLEHWVMRQAKAILTVCEDLTKKARSLVPAANIYQIEDFPTESATVVDLALEKQLRQELQLNPGPVLLYSGNFEAYQGLDLLLDSVAQLKHQTESPFTLVLVGGNQTSIEAYRGKAVKLGIADHLRFTGFRPEEQIGTFFKIADVLVSPRTLGGNTPLKLYSYMAAGKPIVATRISSHTQVLSDTSAFLAAPSPSQLSGALLAAIDPSHRAEDDRRARAEACLELIRERYNAREFHRRMSELYEFALGTKPGSANKNSLPLRAALS